MRIANYEGRLVVVTGEEGHEVAHDVEKNSGGRFAADPQAVYEDWDAFTRWAATARWEDGATVRPEALGSPVPAPRQVFGIGLNYRDHAAESGCRAGRGTAGVHQVPQRITGPHGDIEMPPGGHVDWEVELVAVIGRRAHQVGRTRRWTTWPATRWARTSPNACCSWPPRRPSSAWASRCPASARSAPGWSP